MEDSGTKAIVLRTFESGESNLVIRFLTKDHGKVVAVAQSVKKSKKRFGSGIDILDFGTASFKAGRSEDLALLDSFSERGSFHELRNNLDKLTIASLLAECFDLLTKEDLEVHHFEPIFETLELSLRAINESKDIKECLKACYLALSFLSGVAGISDHSDRAPSMKALDALLDDVERFLEKQLTTRESLKLVFTALMQAKKD